MPGRESAITCATRRHRRTLIEVGGELRTARLSLGFSIATVSNRAGMSASKVGRVERTCSPNVSLADLAVLASVVGLDLSVKLYPGPPPVRDVAHLRLLGRLRDRLHPSLVWRTEVPLAVANDQRAWDATVTGRGFRIAVEAETRLVDVQAVDRRTALKQRDGEVAHVILLVADTRLNRAALRTARPMAGYPVPTRVALDALRRGDDPGGSAVVVL